MSEPAASGPTRRSIARRIAAAVITLAVIDLFVPSWVARAEKNRYEGPEVFRVASSDLFAIGPAVAYLRSHPRGDRPRTVFAGNSTVWGWGLRDDDTLPGQFQRLEPSSRVLNFGVNGFDLGSSYLVIKAVIDSVDVVYAQADGTGVNRGLARLLPVDDEDVARFGLEPPDRIEGWLERRVAVWKLYGLSYRLQAALFGTSTRNYLYTHKAGLFGGSASAGSQTDAPDAPPGARPVTISHRVAEPNQPIDERALAQAEPRLWEFATLIRAEGKRAVFWKILNDGEAPLEWAELNRVFRGQAVFATVAAPPELMIDRLHLSAQGSAMVAGKLHDLALAELTGNRAVH